MTEAPQGELSASSIIANIEAGGYPLEVIGTIARGFLPLEQRDLIAVLSYLAGRDDAEIAEMAHASLRDIPSRALLELSADEAAPADHLRWLMQAADDQFVLEALIRNRAVPDDAVVQLAHKAAPGVQEIIVINQARIIRAPEILDALLANPSLSPDVRRRALENREEFFDKRARIEAERAEEEEEEEIIDIPLDPIADLLASAAELDGQPAEPTVVALEVEKTDPKKQAVFAKIQFMSISEKVQLAFKGDRTVRMILVRDRNRLVCNSVMRNPRMTEREIESIAGMRNVEDDVLRQIALKRDWSSKYVIVLTLCRNPKTPIGVVLPLINRLTLRDLKGLKDDKGIPQAVRENAKKLYLSKTQKNR